MPTPAEVLLDHLDDLTKCEATFRGASGSDTTTKLNMATYRGFPDSDCLTSFTIGLSHLPLGDQFKELTISMRDPDDVWTLACGYAAKHFWQGCSFNRADIIDFGENISPTSEMSAFVSVNPLFISVEDRKIDTGVHKIDIMQLLPIYEKERIWLAGGGDLEQFLQGYEPEEFMNPIRPVFTP